MLPTNSAVSIVSNERRETHTQLIGYVIDVNARFTSVESGAPGQKMERRA